MTFGKFLNTFSFNYAYNSSMGQIIGFFRSCSISIPFKLNRNGTGMERELNRNGTGMEWELNRNGTEIQWKLRTDNECSVQGA